MGKWAGLILGLTVAISGFGVDLWLTSKSPGVSLPQLLSIAVGLMIAGLSLTSRQVKGQPLPAQRHRRKFAIAAILAALTLLVAEQALALWGMPTYFASEPPDYQLRASNWWTCDVAGCHYVHSAVMSACDAGELEGRVCAVNLQGYSDEDDFAWEDDLGSKVRVLLLGDSFTYGMSADVGSSFAERLDQTLAGSVIWNTGIPGGGTHQALAAFEVYAPRLRPHLTILGFVMNDFDDNLLPIDSWLNAIDPSGNAVAIRMFKVDSAEKVSRHDVDDIEYFLTYWKIPPANELERQLGHTRLGTLLLGLVDAIEARQPADARFGRREQVTRDFLQELRDSVYDHGSEFALLLVPGPEDIGRPGMRYLLARDIVNSLAIPYIDPIDQLVLPADYAPSPDDHWSNSGHQKVGAILVDCINEVITGGAITDCAHVTMPPN